MIRRGLYFVRKSALLIKKNTELRPVKNILTILLCFLTILSTAQLDYSLGPIPASMDTTASAEDFIAHSMIRNHSDETIVIAWQRITNDIPDGWESYICSNITCAPPDVSMGTFSLTANDSTNLDIYFVPDGVPGNGIVDLRFFLTDDTTQVIYATYFGNASPVHTTQALRDQLNVFPNPANQTLFIEGASTNSVEIFSANGTLIRSYSNQTSLDISALTNGFYILKIYSDEKELRSINSFQKISP